MLSCVLGWGTGSLTPILLGIPPFEPPLFEIRPLDPPLIGIRFSAIGIRSSVIGIRFSDIGIRLSAIGIRFSAIGSRLAGPDELSRSMCRLVDIGSMRSTSTPLTRIQNIFHISLDQRKQKKRLLWYQQKIDEQTIVLCSLTEKRYFFRIYVDQQKQTNRLLLYVDQQKLMIRLLELLFHVH